jgi:hypothetical protein
LACGTRALRRASGFAETLSAMACDMRFLLSLFLVGVAASGCDTFSPGGFTTRAQLRYANLPAVFLVPDTVRQSEPFDVEFAFYGSTACASLDHMEVSLEGTVAILEPVIRIPEGICPSDIREYRAKHTLALSNPGGAELRLVGWAQGTDTIVVRRTWVRP